MSDLPRFEIWSEGYAVTGNSEGAHYHGHGYGKTFQEACDVFFAHRPGGNNYDRNRMTYWGCRLFDNEADARQLFG